LKGSAGAMLDLPAVSIMRGPETPPKLNFTALWSGEENCFLILVSRAGSQSNIEVELSRQIRARLIAEAEVTHKSKALTKANAELARANQDLEEFASIISHDLKGPMRALRYMADDVAKEAGITARPEVLAQLSKMRDQSQRMSEMLTSLLEYSSAGRKEDVVEEVDTAALLAAIVRATPCPAGFAIQSTGMWPRIETLRAPLDLVMRNLIENAIKHHDRPVGTIRAGCEDRGDALRFEIEDDGPGIDPRHHASVFLPFRRLNAEAGREGQGMGLAFVKRWVEASGGRIGLQSAAPVRRGTVFWVEWPKQPRR
jgi:signal transduction histidine kinase